MKIYSVQNKFLTSQNKNRTNPYSATQKESVNTFKDQVSFGNELDDRVNARKPKGFFANIGFALTKGKIRKEEAAKMENERQEMRDQNNILRGKRAGITMDTKTIKKQYKENMDQRDKSLKTLSDATTKQQETNDNITKEIAKDIKLIERLESTGKTLADLNEKQNKLIETQTKEMADLKEQLKAANEKADEKMQQILDEKVKKLKEQQNIAVKQIKEQINETSNMAKLYADMANTNKAEGFGRIAGYKKEIQELINVFGGTIIDERQGKSATVPSGIMYYGPTGTGKTTFAKAFASHTGCEIKKLTVSKNENINIKLLQKTLNKAKKRFTQDRTRTFVLIDEFNAFAPEGSKTAEYLKAMMDTITKEYHSTIIANTNYPNEVDSKLLRDGRFHKSALPPADKENAIEVLKHYTEKYADADVDYDKLANKVIAVQPKEAYSNSRLKDISETLTTKYNQMGKKLTHQSILDAISGPDIDEKAYELFKTQLKYVAGL